MIIRNTEPKRVVHVITTLNIGGAERMLCKLLKREAGAGSFEHYVICLGIGGKLVSELRENGIPVYEIGMRKRVGDMASLIRLARRLRRLRPHLIQTWLYHADLVGTFIGRLFSDAKIVWNVRCSNMNLVDYGVATRVVFGILAKLSRIPDTIIFNSSAGRRFHEDAGYHIGRSIIIPNGFDASVYAPNESFRKAFRESVGVGEKCHVVGMVARYDPMKDYDTFFAAAGRLRKQMPNLVLVTVGRGMDTSNVAVRRMIDKHELNGHVVLLGEQQDLNTIYPGFDILTLTSSYGEGFPNVLGEAMACGVPCVATDVGDAGLIIGSSGLVVPSGRPESLAEAWRSMLQLSADQVASLSKLARYRIVTRYSIDHIQSKYYALFQSLLFRPS